MPQFSGRGIAVNSRKTLAFLRHHPMAMEIAVRPDIHHDLEPHVRILKSTSDFLPASRTVPKITLQKLAAFIGSKTLRSLDRVVPARVRLLKKDSGEYLRFGIRIVFHEADLSFRFAFDRNFIQKLADCGIPLI